MWKGSLFFELLGTLDEVEAMLWVAASSLGGRERVWVGELAGLVPLLAAAAWGAEDRLGEFWRRFRQVLDLVRGVEPRVVGWVAPVGRPCAWLNLARAWVRRGERVAWRLGLMGVARGLNAFSNLVHEVLARMSCVSRRG